MKYLKVWTSFRELISTLEYDEVGRLFEMMLIYADNGEEPMEITGHERFLWPVAKQMIDMANEKAETLRQNGSKGGIAKSKNRQDLANRSNLYQGVASGSNHEQNVAYKEKKRKEKERKEIFVDDDDARAIAEEQDKVLCAAENAGFTRSESVRSKLIDLFSVHGMEKMLDAIDACVTHGAPNLAYLMGVLKGEPKRTKPKVAAQNYEQRSYEDEDKAAMRRMLEELNTG